MRKFILVVLIIAVVAAGAVVFSLSTGNQSANGGVRFPLNAGQRALLAAVPADADTFALIPAASGVRAKLIANPVTHDPILDWIDKGQIPRPWMIGDATVVMWRAGRKTSYAIHLDRLRAAIVRVYLMFGSGLDARVTSGTLLINSGGRGEPIGLSRVDQLLAIANGLPAADAVVVQQGSESNGFPPIGRPAVTAVEIGRDDINLTSVAPRSGAAPGPSVLHRFPAGALITATFRRPPRVVSDLDRILMARVSHLLDDGGSIVLYDVNAGTLMPRPVGLIVANATAQNEAVLKRIEQPARTFGDIHRVDGHLLVSFEKDSMARYEAETFVDGRWPSNDWAVRLDPRRSVPVLERLGDNTGLRLIAPRLYRSARDLRRWVEYLAAARSIEAAHSVTATTEELRVRVAK